MKKLLWLLALLVLLVGGAAVVAVHYQRPVRTLAVDDDSGQTLALFRLPGRVVVLDPAAGRLLAQLGQTSKVVAVSSELAVTFPSAEQLGAAAAVDPLSVLAVRPDLVVVGPATSDLGEQLRQHGSSVFRMAPQSLEQLYSGLTRLGKLAGAEAQASTISQGLQAELAALRPSGITPVPVLYWLDEQLTALGQGTFINELIGLVGGRNLVQVEGTAVFTLAEAQAAVPTVIFGPQSVLLTINPALFVSWVAVPEQSALQPQITPPRLVEPPADFTLINWETVQARAAWLRQQILP